MIKYILRKAFTFLEKKLLGRENKIDEVQTSTNAD